MPRLSSAVILPRTNKFVPLVIVATPTKSSLRMHAATIQGRLLFFSLSSRCGCYLRAATIRGAASIQIIQYAHEKNSCVPSSNSRTVPYKRRSVKL